MPSNKINECKQGSIRVYKFLDNAFHPQLVCKHNVNALPKCLCSFYGGLMVAVGKKIQFYRLNDKNEKNLFIADQHFEVELNQNIKTGNFYICQIEQMNDEKNKENVPNLLVCDN